MWRPIALLVALLVLGGGCAGDDGGSASVVAGFYPLAWAAERVVGDELEVVNLTPAGAEPHDLELSPRDVEAVRDARLVVYAGGGFQPALEEAVDERTARSLDVLRLGESDPHVWLDPLRFGEVAAELARALGPSERARRLTADLKELHAEYRRGLAQCDRRVVVTTHAAFGHLAARYGLEQVALAGLSPESEPSPRALERLVEQVERSGATTVFAEPLVSDRVAETVAREAGATLATLDPLEGLSEERLDDGDDYLSVMRDNLRSLRRALGCR